MEAEFLLSAAASSQFPKSNYPEIAFAGRSNVGKSSMINKLLLRKNLVKTGNTPGKTRLVNFFLVEKQLVFTDLPGYGYAAVSKAEKASWGKLINTYFSVRKQLSMCVLLLDIRRLPNNDDLDMLEAMKIANIETISVLTKADKLSNNQKAKQLNAISQALAMDKSKLITFSSVTGEGRDKVWDIIKGRILL